MKNLLFLLIVLFAMFGIVLIWQHPPGEAKMRVVSVRRNDAIKIDIANLEKELFTKAKTIKAAREESERENKALKKDVFLLKKEITQLKFKELQQDTTINERLDSVKTKKGFRLRNLIPYKLRGN